MCLAQNINKKVEVLEKPDPQIQRSDVCEQNCLG